MHRGRGARSSASPRSPAGDAVTSIPGCCSAAVPTPGGSGSPTTRGRPRGSGSSTSWPASATSGWNSGRTATCRPTRPARSDELAARALQVAGGTMHGYSGLHRAGDFAGDRREDPQGGGADRGGGRRARDLRAGARLPRRRDRRLPRAGRARRRTSGRRWSAVDQRPRQDPRRGVRPAHCSSTRTPTATSRPRRRPSGSWPRPIPGTSRSAWTPGTSRTGGRTAWRSSRSTRTGSGTCTSSRWTRRSWPRPRRRTWRSARPSRWAPAASRPPGSRTIPPIVEALRGLDAAKFVIVEQDMYPTPFDVPEPIAARTRTYLRGVGVGG